MALGLRILRPDLINMFKDGAWMLLSTGLRLVSGLLVFVVVARQLGPAAFGTLMTAFAASMILAIPAHYGLSVFMLNEAAKEQDRGRHLLSRGLGLKLALVLPLASLIWPTAVWLELPLQLMVMLFLMHVIEGCTELLCVHQRVTEQFQRETRFVTSQSVLQFAVIATVTHWYGTIQWVALGFLLSRIASFTVAVVAFGHLGDGGLVQFKGVHRLGRRAMPYFFDFSAQSFLVQIDAVLLGVMAGPAAVGTYQAGMRLVHGMSQLITVMVNVALPRLARRELTHPIGLAVSAKVWGAFVGAGTLVALPLIFFAHEVARLLFGDTFHTLAPVLQVLGVLIVIRFAAAGSGMLLIAMGEQRMRAGVVVVATVVLCLLAMVLMPAHGAQGAAYSISGAYAFILVSFSLLMIARLRERARTRAT